MEPGNDSAGETPVWSFPVSGLPLPEPLVMCDTGKLDSPMLGYTRSPAILCRGAKTSSPYRTITKRSAKRQRRRKAGFTNLDHSPRTPLSPLVNNASPLAASSVHTRKGSPAAGLMSPRSRIQARRMSMHTSSPARVLAGKRGRDPMCELQEEPAFTPSPTKRRRRLSFEGDAASDGYHNDPCRQRELMDDVMSPAITGAILSPSCVTGEEQVPVLDEEEQAEVEAQKARDKRQVKLWEAVREVVSTEETYWKSLLQMRLAYLEAAQNAVKGKEVEEVFSNITELQTRAYDLLLALRKTCAQVPDRGEGPGLMSNAEIDATLKGMANVFLEFLPSAQADYTTYCSAYTLAHERCTQLEKENSRFRGVLRKARREHDVPCIYDIMILPVQRLPRYQILLMAVIGYVDEQRFPQAKARLEAALDCIMSMNAVVDAAIRKSENEKKMEELKASFAPESSVTFERPGRFIIRQAKVSGVVNEYYRCQLPTGPLLWLDQEDAGEQHEFLLVLFSDILVVAKESRHLPASVATSGKYTICETLPVDLVFLVEEGDEFRSRSRLSVSAPNGLGIKRQPGQSMPAPAPRSKGNATFQFVSPRLGLTIHCKCRSDGTGWRTALQDAVTEHLAKNPTLMLTRTHIAVQKDRDLEQWHCVEDVLCRSTDRIPRDRFHAANIADEELLKLQADPRFQEFYQKRCASTSEPAPAGRIGSRVIHKVSKAAISPMRFLSPGNRMGKGKVTSSRRLFARDAGAQQ